MFTELFKKIFWYISLVFVLVFLGWGLTVMTDKIDYVWYWNRMPQHFFFTGNIEKFASAAGALQCLSLGTEFKNFSINAIYEIIENGVTN